MLLKDKTAIVTGGGRGIGRGIARRFAREGARVVLGQRDPESGQRTQGEIEAAGGTALFVPTDVAQRSAADRLVEAARERFGGVDVLVNNAGITGLNGPFLEVSQETWDQVIGVNLTGVFNCSQAAARVMSRQGGGTISLGEQAAGASGGSGGAAGAGGAGGAAGSSQPSDPLEGMSDEQIAARTPEDIVPDAYDDVVARQLREAALSEEDPVLRERL